MVPRDSRIRLALVCLLTATASLSMTILRPRAVSGGLRAGEPESHRSPIALALSPDGSRLLSANQTAGSVSLIDVREGRVLQELPTGEKPAGVAFSRDGKRAAVTHWYGYDLAILDVRTDSIAIVGRVEVGPEPRGVVLSGDGSTAYVAVGASNEVVRVDLNASKVTGRVVVGREPRGIALTGDGGALLVGNARSKDMSVVSTAGDMKVERTLPIVGDNLRQVALSADGKTGYVVNMRNRGFATTANNIDIGWVLGQRLTRVLLDGSEPFETISLDAQGAAVSDVHGVALSGNGRYVAVSSGGTHEVLLLRADSKPLPWRSGGSRDLIAPELLRGDGRFRRVPVGGRPTEMVFSPDNKTIYVTNYLEDSVQIVDAEEGKLTRSIALGGPASLSLERRGEILFHDARRSFNQWYSCNTCHSDGHTNGLDFDTFNDGRHDFSTSHLRSRKKVPTLRGVDKTGPWTWHGWQKDLDEAVVESFTKSMQGPRPKDDEAKAVVAYLKTLEFPRNPNREPNGDLTQAARRGREVFRSPKAACNTCHGGPEFTDGKIHIVGLEERDDAYTGYNPPSLRGVYDKDPYLHDGRAKTLEEALKGDHDPDSLAGMGALTADETKDLIAYLKSL